MSPEWSRPCHAAAPGGGCAHPTLHTAPRQFARWYHTTRAVGAGRTSIGPPPSSATVVAYPWWVDGARRRLVGATHSIQSIPTQDPTPDPSAHPICLGRYWSVQRAASNLRASRCRAYEARRIAHPSPPATASGRRRSSLGANVRLSFFFSVWVLGTTLYGALLTITQHRTPGLSQGSEADEAAAVVHGR